MRVTVAIQILPMRSRRVAAGWVLGCHHSKHSDTYRIVVASAHNTGALLLGQGARGPLKR